MSNPVQPVHAVQAATQVASAAAAPKPQPTAKQTAAPQDKITISPHAQQALAANAKPAASGDKK
jgi:hypothetical protein